MIEDSDDTDLQIRGEILSNSFLTLTFLLQQYLSLNTGTNTIHSPVACVVVV
jgi:hypothetical protein